MKTSKFGITSLIAIVSFIISASTLKGQTPQEGRIIKIKASNMAGFPREDQILSIPVENLKKINSDFNEKSFVVYDGEAEIPSQTEDINGDGLADNVVILADFEAGENKTLIIETDKTAIIKKEYKKRTQAELSVKVDYQLENGVYSGGKFQRISSTEVPATHFAHDALYKYEGPGWESDLAAYRFYLDSRNRTDIWGKKVNQVILHKVGNNDLVSDSKESYTKMNDWGMDIFKVGESLGLGSIATLGENKVQTVSKTDKVTCMITTDGPVRSGVYTKYNGWQVGSRKFDLTSLISISAGSRLSKEDITINGEIDNICTGFAKHEGCKFIKDNNSEEWSYIASYGLQSLSGDSLGLAIFFKRSDMIKSFEDAASYLLTLKPLNGEATYYFAAAWEKEANGIKNEKEFIDYLNTTAAGLSRPVNVEF